MNKGSRATSAARSASRRRRGGARAQWTTIARAPGPPGYSDKAEAYLAANHAFTKKTLDEDFEIAEQIQRGIHTGANDFFRFSRFEGALTRWHQRLEEKLAR